MVDQPNTPPHSLEAEQALLGAVFCDPTILDDLRGNLKPTDFWRASHQVIWQAILASDLGHDSDWVTVGEQVRKMGRVDDCGGADALHAYLIDISQSTPSAYGFERYAAIIKDRALRREVIQRASDLRSKALDDTQTGGDVVAAFARDAEALMDDAVTTPDADAVEIMAELAALYERPPEAITTTFDHLDATGMFTLGSLNVISGRPGHGKSTLAANMAQRMHAQGIPVGVVTLEMTRAQFAQVMVAARAGVSRARQARGNLGPSEVQDMRTAMNELSRGWKITDKPATIEQVGALCRRWRKRDGIKVVFVDHLQRVLPTDARLDAVQNIAHITWSLAELARSTGLVIILGAQLNREAEKDKGSVQQRHLKGGGSIEEDAAMVIQIKVDETVCQPNDPEWVLDLVKAKDRYGQLARCPIRFMKSTGRMVEISTSDAVIRQFQGGAA